MDSNVIVALVAGAMAIAGAGVTRAIDWYGAKKVGIGQLQTELITTYEKTVKAQRDRIDQLTSDLNDERERRSRMERHAREQDDRIDALESLLKDALREADAIRTSARRRRPRTTEATT